MGSFPPTGILGGQYSDVGLYRECINLSLPRESHEKRQTHISGYTSYCSVPFRPILPRRPDFHMISSKVPKEMIEQFNSTDIFNLFANQAQFFYYIYMKTAICIPHECSAWDVQQIAGVISRRLALMAGPVKCYSRAPSSSEELKLKEAEFDFGRIENTPVAVRVNEALNRKQKVALVIIVAFFGIVLLATLWHATEMCVERCARLGKDQEDFASTWDQENNPECNVSSRVSTQVVIVGGQLEDAYHKRRRILKHFAFNYMSFITNLQDYLNVSMKSNEIKCLHGLRALTMIWIICVHYCQYSEWSGFTRIFEVIPTLQNIALQPLYNANYVVDNFFLMSGLLASYTAWYSNRGSSSTFSFKSSLIGRYLRLTPQVLLISLFYILLPKIGEGPFWYDMTHEAAKYCEKNWWVNLLHLQAFYREDEICNLVGWWISVDMAYYVLATLFIYLLLSKRSKLAMRMTCVLLTFCISFTAYRHYVGGYTPNNLGIVPQVNEVWSQYIVFFFWSPYPHAFPFFLGLWLGYMLANNKWRYQVREWSRLGWTLSISSLILVNLSSHIWMAGHVELNGVQAQYISTSYNILCAICWALGYSWIIVGCHYGCGPTLNKLLSSQVFVLLSKASFIIYLSHMLLIRTYFGLQNTLMEVSIFPMLYGLIGNIFLSGLMGVFLCISFEGPCMKMQRVIIRSLNKSQPKKSETATKYEVPVSSILIAQYGGAPFSQLSLNGQGEMSINEQSIR